MSVDGSECLRSDVADEDLRCLLLDLVVVITEGGISSEEPCDTTVAFESWGTPKSSLSSADAGSMRSDISKVNPSASGADAGVDSGELSNVELGADERRGA